MSRCFKCSSCGDDIEIGDVVYKIDCEYYCKECVTTDILDDSYFEDDDSHAILEERLLAKYEQI